MKKTCIHCDATFETHLAFQKYCNPDCQTQALGFRRTATRGRQFVRNPEYAAAEAALVELQAAEATQRRAMPRYSTLAGTPEVYATAIRDDQLTGGAAASSYGTHTHGLGVEC